MKEPFGQPALAYPRGKQGCDHPTGVHCTALLRPSNALTYPPPPPAMLCRLRTNGVLIEDRLLQLHKRLQLLLLQLQLRRHRPAPPPRPPTSGTLRLVMQSAKVRFSVRWMLNGRPVREGVSKGEEDGRRPPARRAYKGWA
jgi:hypothetical protein